MRNFIFNLHSIAGLIAGFFILLMSISGAVLVFHDELNAIQQPTLKNINNSQSNVDDNFAAVKKQYPTAQISSCALPTENDKPLTFIIYDSIPGKNIETRKVFLNPQTGEILKTTQVGSGFADWLSKFHNSFHLGKIGEWLLGFFSIIFFISIVSGIIIFRKKIVPVLLFKKTIYNKRNLHQLVGVYALLFNLMIAVTGFWMQRYVFKKEFYSSNNYAASLKATPLLPYKFDEAFKKLQLVYPNFTAYTIYFAQSPKGKTAVYGSRASNAYIHSKKFADVIFLDSTGNISNTRFVNEIDAADRYDIINSQLHMGNFGGVGIKIIYFIFGLSGSLLSITGFFIWYNRR